MSPASVASSYAAILQVLTDAGVDTTDVHSALVAHSSENIYYRTDHHWTSLGAYYAYCAWRGIEPNADAWTQEALCENFYGTTWNKVPLPAIPAEEITAWYKYANRHVSYNGGQYETDSIYERKYLSGSDQYAVFLNSNQVQTVIEGSGKSGRLLLIKDSFGNTFAQFPVEDYAEVHVIDLRFFKGDIVEYAKVNGITDTLVLYGAQNFVSDTAGSGSANACLRKRNMTECLYALEHFMEPLMKWKSEKTLALFSRLIDAAMANASDRNAYRCILAHAASVSAYPGGREFADQLLKKWEAQYHRKSALLDEMKKMWEKRGL